MFFSKITTILATCQSLSIVMEQKDEVITLSVLPKYKDDKAKVIPLVMSGTATELDNGFADAMGKVEANSGIFSNIDAFIKQAKEEEKALKAKTGTKVPPVTTDKTEVKSETNKSTKDAKPPKETAKPIELAADLFNTAGVETKQPETVQTKASEPAKVELPAAPEIKKEVTPEAKPEPVVTTSVAEPTATTTKAPTSITDEDDIF
jgi:PRTRC genetic system protein E